MSLRKTTQRNPSLQQTLVDTFTELITENWIEPVEENICVGVNFTWYLPFFVTKTAKPRVVYDGSATFKGISLNQIVLSGENLFNNLLDVLIRFRLGKFACVADLSKCFFQVRLPKNQQNLFRLVWFKDNNKNDGIIQIYRFTRHVWGINSSPFVALMAIKRLVEENPTNAGQLTLETVKNNRYMDDILLACTSFNELQAIASEAVDLFRSRGFRLRKWVANSHAKEILWDISKTDLAPPLGEVDIGCDPLPDSGTLGLTWDPQQDVFRINCKSFKSAVTRREMSSQLASQFDPLGMASPFLLGGKLLLQQVAISGVDWDDVLSLKVQGDWKKWLENFNLLREITISRNCLADNLRGILNENDFQLHAFCDASNSAFCCVVYLKCVGYNKTVVKFLMGKSRVVLTSQSGWVISRKELETARMSSELMLQAEKALERFNCNKFFWTDFRVVLGWIINPDLNLSRFVKRRVNKILRVAPNNV